MAKSSCSHAQRVADFHFGQFLNFPLKAKGAGKACPMNLAAMYAIAYDFDTAALEFHLGPNYRLAYKQFKDYMKKHGFISRQGSLLVAEPRVTGVDAVIAIQSAARTLPWLGWCITDIRLLRLAASDDLGPAVRAAAGTSVANNSSDDEVEAIR